MISPKDALLVNHISDPKLQALFLKLNRNDYSVVTQGEAVLSETKDTLDIYKLMELSLNNIIEDLREHGDENLALYDNHDQAYFESKLADVKSHIEALKAEGKTSPMLDAFLVKKKAAQTEVVDAITKEEKKQAGNIMSELEQVRIYLNLPEKTSPLVIMAELGKRGFKPTDDLSKAVEILKKQAEK